MLCHDRGLRAYCFVLMLRASARMMRDDDTCRARECLSALLLMLWRRHTLLLACAIFMPPRSLRRRAQHVSAIDVSDDASATPFD